MVKWLNSHLLKLLRQFVIYHGIKLGGNEFELLSPIYLQVKKLKILHIGPHLLRGNLDSCLKRSARIIVKWLNSPLPNNKRFRDQTHIYSTHSPLSYPPTPPHPQKKKKSSLTGKWKRRFSKLYYVSILDIDPHPHGTWFNHCSSKTWTVCRNLPHAHLQQGKTSCILLYFTFSLY